MGKFLPEGNIPRIYIVRGHVFFQLKRWWNFRFSQTERSTSTASNQWELWSHFFDFPKYPDPSKAWLFWGPYRTLPLIYIHGSNPLDCPMILRYPTYLWSTCVFFLGGGKGQSFCKSLDVFFLQHRWRTNGLGPWSSVWTMRPLRTRRERCSLLPNPPS